MDDAMEYGDLLGLEDGWLYDVVRDEKFHVDEDGVVINEDGEVIGTIEEEEDDNAE